MNRNGSDVVPCLRLVLAMVTRAQRDARGRFVDDVARADRDDVQSEAADWLHWLRSR